MHCEHHMASAGHVVQLTRSYSFNNNQIGYWILAILAQYCSLAVLNWELKFDEKTVCKPVIYTCNTSIHISSTKHFICWRDPHPVVMCISKFWHCFSKFVYTSWQHKHNGRFVTQKTGIRDAWVRHPSSPYIFACFSYCPPIASAWVHFPVQKPHKFSLQLTQDLLLLSVARWIWHSSLFWLTISLCDNVSGDVHPTSLWDRDQLGTCKRHYSNPTRRILHHPFHRHLQSAHAPIERILGCTVLAVSILDKPRK